MKITKKIVLILLVLCLLSLGTSSVVFGQEPSEGEQPESSEQPGQEVTPTPEAEPAEPPAEAPAEPPAEPPAEEVGGEPLEVQPPAAIPEAQPEPTEVPALVPQAPVAVPEAPENADETLAPAGPEAPELIEEAAEPETVAPASDDIGTSVVVNPPGQSSNVLIQNLTNANTTVTVKVYKPGGGTTTIFNNTFTIAAKGARTVHAGSGTNDTGHLFMNLTDPQSAMVVESSGRVVAANVSAGGTTVHHIYEGTEGSQTSTDILLPSIHWRDAQWSLFSVQNAGTGPANVEIKYFTQNGTQIGATIQKTLQAGEPEFRNAREDVSIASQPAGVGSVRVTSTNGQPLASSVMETLGTAASSYSGIPFSAADTKWTFPSVHRNPGGQFSHILVQNTDTTQAALVTIKYFDQAGNQVDSFANVSIGASGALTFHTTNAPSDNGQVYDPTHLGNVGSATVETTNGVKVVATVVETIGAFPYTYNGFNNSAGATTLTLPSVHRNPGGQHSHTLVQNLDAGNTNNIQLTYFKQDGTQANQFTKNLPNAGSITFHTDGNTSSDGVTYDPTNLGNVGSAEVTSTDGRNIVAVVVETLPGFLPGAYAGFK